MGGSSDELVLPLASKLNAIVSLLLTVSSVSSSATISSVSFGATMTVLFGRPRGRLTGGGASSKSVLPSSKPESLSGGLWVMTVSFGEGVLPEPPLRVLIRTFVDGIAAVKSFITGKLTAGVVVMDITGVTLLKLLLLLLLEVPFFSANVKGSSMIIQSELDPSSFSSSRTLVMLLDTGRSASGIGCITGTATGELDVVGCLFKSTEAGIA